MNSDFDKQWEPRIGRELKQLPDLNAPATLATRVMARIEQRSALPWYRQSWQTWSVGLRIASFAVLLALFGGLYLAGSALLQEQSVTIAFHRAGEWVSGLDVIWKTLAVLADALVLTVEKLGTGFIVGFFAVAALCYAACVGLGTLVVRFATARR